MTLRDDAREVGEPLMNQEDINRLRELHEAATPGPWWTFYYDAGDKDEYDNCPSIQAPEKEDCAVIHWDGFKQKYWTSANGDQRQIDANAALIVALRNALPTLIAEAERAKLLEDALRRIADGPWPDDVQSAEDQARWDETIARTALEQADGCPSCGGLNLSCPEGCGRDENGELDGSTLEQKGTHNG